MPASKRPKPIYQRGTYRLYRRADRANLEIVWYDDERRRERSTSAGTGDVSAGRLALDRLYLQANGQRMCGECGRPSEHDASPLLANAIADYLLLSEAKAGYKATRGRLAHAVEYLVLTSPAATCAQIDRRWVDGFRKWLAAKPVVVGKSGATRVRALGATEGCVLQLAAAINATPGQRAQFTAEQPKTVAKSPTYRADVEMLAAMFRFCLQPKGRTEKEQAQRRAERVNFLAYLRAAVATWARPEEIMDLGAGQWAPAARVLDLNPLGRRQTRKYRGRIPIAHQFAPYLDGMGETYLPVSSIRQSWETCRAEIGLPVERGQAGWKLIRRSMATLVRRRIGEAHWRQGEMMLGHVKHSISDIYAMPDPANLGLALAATEAIIDEIEALTPGAYRAVTAPALTLKLVEGGKNG